MVDTVKILKEVQTDMQEAHSELRLAIKKAETMHNYIIFLDLKQARRLSELCDAFLYE